MEKPDPAVHEFSRPVAGSSHASRIKLRIACFPLIAFTHPANMCRVPVCQCQREYALLGVTKSTSWKHLGCYFTVLQKQEIMNVTYSFGNLSTRTLLQSPAWWNRLRHCIHLASSCIVERGTVISVRSCFRVGLGRKAIVTVETVSPSPSP